MFKTPKIMFFQPVECVPGELVVFNLKGNIKGKREAHNIIIITITIIVIEATGMPTCCVKQNKINLKIITIHQIFVKILRYLLNIFLVHNLGLLSTCVL